MSRDSKSKWLLAVALVALPSLAQADKALTLDEALNLSRDRNKDLKAAKARVDQAQTQIGNALAALLPTVAMNGKYTHNYKEVLLDAASFTGGALQQTQGQLTQDLVQQSIASAAAMGNTAVVNKITADAQAVADAAALAANQPPIVIQKAEQLDYTLSATIPLLVPAAYPGYSAAKKQVEAAKSQYKVSDTQILMNTAAAFFAAAGTDELVGARQNAIRVAQQTLSNAKARLEAGVVNRVEVTRAEIALLRAQQASLEAGDQQSSAYRALRTIIQIDEPFHVVPEEFANVPTRPMPELAENALKLRPEVPALERQAASYKSQASSALWQWAPTISGFGNFRAFNYKGFAGDNYSWALGLSLDWVIYDGGRRDAARKLANAQARETEFRLSLLKDQLVDELYDNRRKLDTKRRALETAISSVRLSKETLELVRVQHDAGTATQLDLLQAQDNLVLSEVGVAQARFDLALADLQLRRSAGMFPVPQK